MTELLQYTLFGLMLGCVYAIASMGLVLTYNVTGVFNFAHGAVGMLAAFVYYYLRVDQHVPNLVFVDAANRVKELRHEPAGPQAGVEPDEA